MQTPVTWPGEVVEGDLMTALHVEPRPEDEDCFEDELRRIAAAERAAEEKGRSIRLH